MWSRSNRFRMDFSTVPIERKVHTRYFLRILNVLPAHFQGYSTNRLILAFFSVCGLDVLNSLDELKNKQRQDLINWIYSLQVLPVKDNSTNCGFQGGSVNSVVGERHKYDNGHLAMTYAALATLVTLGDDLSQVNKEAVLDGVKRLQNTDGSFYGTVGEENDMRFVYCAACVCYILNDFTFINLDALANFVTNSLGYDGGIGQGPGLESHGGSTFCGLAALSLCGIFDEVLTREQINKLGRWCISRQVSGFHGRPSKPPDTCYSFWVGASLHILDIFNLVNFTENRNYIMSTQDNVQGGFSKWEDCIADPLHTYLGLCGLSLMGEEGLAPVQPSLNVTKRAHDYLKKLQESWAR